MDISSALQQNPYWDYSDLVFEPYKEGIKLLTEEPNLDLQEAGSEPPNRTIRLIAGVALLLPLVNIIVFIALKSIAFNGMIEELQQWPDRHNGYRGDPRLSTAISQVRRIMSGGEILDLDLHGIRILPSCIGRLTHLTSIRACHNQLEQLPEGLRNLHKLETLYVRNNQLQSLPNSLRRLPCLRTVDARDNVVLHSRSSWASSNGPNFIT